LLLVKTFLERKNMKNKNPYAPDLSAEQINKIAWELSDTSEDDLTDLTQQFKEIIDREKRKSFQVGFEEGKKLSK
jgi:hypothetical protein